MCPEDTVSHNDKEDEVHDGQRGGCLSNAAPRADTIIHNSIPVLPCENLVTRKGSKVIGHDQTTCGISASLCLYPAIFCKAQSVKYIKINKNYDKGGFRIEHIFNKTRQVERNYFENAKDF